MGKPKGAGDSARELPSRDWLEKLLLEKRAILVVGKGGVGRSSLSAMLAERAAELHRLGRIRSRPVLCELKDFAGEWSALSRVYGRGAGGFPSEPEPLAKGLWGLALDSRRGQELFLSRVIRIEVIAKAALSSEPIRKLLDVAPSFREMGIFFHVLTLVKDQDAEGNPLWGPFILDMPATGHALALTGLPEVLTRMLTRGPVLETLREGQDFFNDASKTTTLLATLPELLPVSEAMELADGLERTKMHIGGVMVNRHPDWQLDADAREFWEGCLREFPRFRGQGGLLKVMRSAEMIEPLRRRFGDRVLLFPEIGEAPRGASGATGDDRDAFVIRSLVAEWSEGRVRA